MSRQPGSRNAVDAAVTLALFLGPALYLARRQRRHAEERRLRLEERASERAFLSALARDASSQPLRPPLPDVVRRVLSRCRFAYLSTIDVDAASSHLSLMRFTYLPEEEVIVLSTNVKTKKYDMLVRQSGVALLIHDFGEGQAGAASPADDDGGDGAARLTGEYSITLNGTCSVVKDGENMLVESCASNALKLFNTDLAIRLTGCDSSVGSCFVIGCSCRGREVQNCPSQEQSRLSTGKQIRYRKDESYDKCHLLFLCASSLLQFIVGKDIAILRVDVASARICNINDEVIKWNVSNDSS
ncbi:hypothetical protein ACHAWF_014579 [Thalassiosira exigua]